MDLLNNEQLKEKYSKEKSADGSGERSEPTVKNVQQESQENQHGKNLMDDVSVDKDNTTKAKSTPTDSENKSADSNSKSSDESSWTLDSALNHIKQLREENKQYRLKYSERETNLKKQQDEEIQQILTKQEELKNAAKELELLKEKEADKKRSLEEKVDHRNKKVVQLEAQLEALKNDYESKLKNSTSELENYKIKIEAQNNVYRKQVEEELNSISDEYKEIANSIVDGAKDNPEEALLRLTKAKLKGIFEDKKVVVNHGVPGANQGARVTNSDIEANSRDIKNKMSSQQKIRAALNDLKDNSAVRFNR